MDSRHPAQRFFARAEDTAWEHDAIHPQLREAYRYRTLIGSAGAPCPDAAMGTLELSPGTYPFHEHPAPEIYYVLRGTAEWTVEDVTFEAREGTAVYHPPGARHRMVNRGGGPLLPVWFWWAPGGRAEVLEQPSRLSDP